MTDLIELRKRAAKLGYKVRKRSGKYQLIGIERGDRGSRAENLEGLELWLDYLEGKRALQITTVCGMPISDNSEAWLAANPGSTMEDFERALPRAARMGGQQ
jgi:hypothetical protein